ncbi:MAG: hypothetical protein L0Y54_05015 [Sporichthyaceae bacterium]|nr:hypothetical protein [Sporichthyaceae bacterium]
MDGPEPTSAATSRLVLTDDDLRRITAAVRDGFVRKSDPPKGRQVLRSWIAPLTGFAILLAAWLVLTHWRPPIEPRVRATSLPATEMLDHPAGGGPVRWRVVGAQAQSLIVTGPQTISLPVDLPLATSECAALATELGGQCAEAISTVLIPASVAISWSTPQPVSLIPSMGDPPPDAGQRLRTARSLRLSLVNPAGRTTDGSADPPSTPAPPAGPSGQPAAATRPQLSIWADTTGHPAQRWCFDYAPTAPATLSIAVGNRQTSRQLRPDSATNFGCSGLQLLVQPGAAASGGRALPPLVTLGGLTSIQVHTEATQINLSDLTGNLVLEPDRIKVFETPTAAAIQASSTIATDLNIQAGSASLALVGHDVTSIDTGEGNLVRTAWERQKELALPIFLGLVGLMTPLLGAAYKNTFDYLVAQPTLLRRNLRRVGRWLWWPVRAITPRRRPPTPPGQLDPPATEAGG